MFRHPCACVLMSVALAAATVVTSPAHADEFVNRVNALVRKAKDDKRSDLVLLPLLPALQPPPSVLRDQYQAALFGRHAPNWTECVAWAQAEPQKKIIESFTKITEDGLDPQKGFVFGLPYGADLAGPELVTKEMYVELGDPPTLAAAKFLYMDELEIVGILMHVESSRLAADGDIMGAIDNMRRWLVFTRQMADRPMLREKKWAMESMLAAFERICDLAYVDFRAEQHKTEPSKLRDLINSAGERSLYLDRIKLPEGDFIAREQLISRVITEKGGPNPETFAPTMARIGAVDRPLRLFSSAAHWDQARILHAGWYDCNDSLKGLVSDWQRRWSLPPFDNYQATRSFWEVRVRNRPRLAVISIGLEDVPSLFPLRRHIDAYQAGARMSLAAYAYFLREKTIPISLSAITPAYSRRVDIDPYSSRGRDIQYFRPEIDTPKDDRGNPKPFELKLFPLPPRPELRVRLDSTHFVVYSVGPDDKPDLALDCTQGQPGKSGDYLFWPPELALERQRLLDSGELK
ncbi:MAG: hypothetical protein IT438_06125 [Phycisphaerales bacterium]|nr:hypothetical protein [Phycisphaerales bacterium]